MLDKGARGTGLDHGMSIAVRTKKTSHRGLKDTQSLILETKTDVDGQTSKFVVDVGGLATSRPKIQLT